MGANAVNDANAVNPPTNSAANAPILVAVIQTQIRNPDVSLTTSDFNFLNSAPQQQIQFLQVSISLSILIFDLLLLLLLLFSFSKPTSTSTFTSSWLAMSVPILDHLSNNEIFDRSGKYCTNTQKNT